MEITVQDTATIAYLRLLIGDSNPEQPILTDAEIVAVAQHETSEKLAAAAILDLIAVNTVLVMRKITSQDLTLDGPAVAAELRAQANALRKQHADEQTADDDWGVQVINYPTPGTQQIPELTAKATLW